MQGGVKDKARHLVDELPENATWDDLMQQIYVRQAVEAGVADSEAGRTIDVKKVRARADQPSAAADRQDVRGLMKLFGTIALFLVGLVCMVALAVSIYPGVLNDLLFLAILLSFIGVPVMAIVGGFVFAWLVWKGRLRRVTIPWRHTGVALLMVLATYTLLKFYVPRRIAFAVSQSSFQTLVEQAPKPDNDTMLLNKRLGLYLVDEYAIDLRGGTYFRVYSGADGIGPDVMSYGFCYNPNPSGSPFGAAHYRTFRMGNGWFWFRASNDWY